MREIISEKDNDKNNICFICQKTRNDCINDSEDFDKHVIMHNKWKYIMLICNILFKDKKEMNNEEYFIYKKIDASIIANKVSNKLNNKSNGNTKLI